MRELQESRSSLEGHVNTLKDQLENSVSTTRNKNLEIETLKKIVNEEKDQKTQLVQKNLATFQDEIQRLQAENQNNRTRMYSLESDSQSLKDELRLLKTQKDQLEEHLKKQKEANSASSQQVREQKDLIENQESALAALKSQLD